MYQLDKSFEQIFLPVDSSRVVLLEDTMCLIVNVQKETLRVAAKDGYSETVFFIFIEVFQCNDESVNGACTFGR